MKPLQAVAVKARCTTPKRRIPCPALCCIDITTMERYRSRFICFIRPMASAVPVGAGLPAKNPTRCMAPASPVFAG